MRKKKYIALIIACTIIILLLIKKNTQSDVKLGHTSYTYNCAWVDWKHASPGGIKKFVDDFNYKFAKTPLNETFKISYGQEGGFRIKGYSICTYGISKEYQILKFSEEETIKKKLMFQVFKDVSYLFENRQKEIFWGTLKESAFRAGDLMGNLIGFYIACGEITEEEVFKLCEDLSISVSLQLEKEDRIQANDSFIPKYEITTKDKIPVFPKLLTKYNDADWVENYIRPLTTFETITFFNQKIVTE